MNGNMEEFEKTINEITDQVTQFQKYQDINQFEEVSSIAKQIFQKIQQAQDQAKVFNNRQMLTNQDPTDYTKITDEFKKFQPFYNLWTTLDNWRISYKSWLHDPFEDLNAQKLEETVDNSNKTMAQVIRYFRDKEMPGIMKIAEQTKTDIDEFKPLVPLALALRTEGM
jgi:dynein heavy chain